MVREPGQRRRPERVPGADRVHELDRRGGDADPEVPVCAKRAIVAGPGNPPVVVDETANLENAARSIVEGAAYDNNLLCIGEKEVFAVESIFDELLDAMTRHKAVRLDKRQIEALTKAAFVPGPGSIR